MAVFARLCFSQPSRKYKIDASFRNLEQCEHPLERPHFLADWSADLLVSHPLHQLHNEDDSSEASTSEQQPCTSATAQAGACSIQGQSQAGQASAAMATAAAAAEASGSRSPGDAEAPPPPYASIELGATAAAPGMCTRNLSSL